MYLLFGFGIIGAVAIVVATIGSFTFAKGQRWVKPTNYGGLGLMTVALIGMIVVLSITAANHH